jgi:hypothetical protein
LCPWSLDHRLFAAEWTGFLERSEDKEDLARMTREHHPRTPSGRRQLYQQAGSLLGLPPAAAAGRKTEKGNKSVTFPILSIGGCKMGIELGLGYGLERKVETERKLMTDMTLACGWR